VVLNTQPIVNGGDGADTLILTATATGYDYQFNTNPVVSVAGTVPFEFHGHGGDDVLIVNTDASYPIPPITYGGGDQTSPLSAGADLQDGDVLAVNGVAALTATYLADGTVDATLDNDGTVTVVGQNVITFTQLEPVDLLGFGTVNVNLPNGDDVVAIAPAWTPTLTRWPAWSCPARPAACPSNQSTCAITRTSSLTP